MKKIVDHFRTEDRENLAMEIALAVARAMPMKIDGSESPTPSVGAIGHVILKVLDSRLRVLHADMQIPREQAHMLESDDYLTHVKRNIALRIGEALGEVIEYGRATPQESDICQILGSLVVYVRHPSMIERVIKHVENNENKST